MLISVACGSKQTADPAGELGDRLCKNLVNHTVTDATVLAELSILPKSSHLLALCARTLCQKPKQTPCTPVVLMGMLVSPNQQHD